MELLLFWLFALVCTGSAVMVIASRNPVHSVLFLILAFFNAAGLFVLIGAEFLAMVLVVVYVGAVAVLFLFVVMMLNINFVQLREGFLQYLPIGALVGLVLMVELIMIGSTWALGTAADRETVAAPTTTVIGVDPEVEAVGTLADGTTVAVVDPNAAGRDDHQHREARQRPLHRVFLPVPDGGRDPAGRHHRRHHPDAAPASRHEAPGHQLGRCTAGRARPSNCARSSRGGGI